MNSTLLLSIVAVAVAVLAVAPGDGHKHNHDHGHRPNGGWGWGSGWGSGSSNYNASCPRTTPEQNRRLALDYKNTVFNNQEYDKIDRFVAENYIGHNPDEPNGRDNLRQAIPTWLEETPKGSFQFVRSAVDDDTVWIHLKMPMFGQDYAVLDILRIECGKIVEHWDVVQAMEADSTNPHPYF